LEHRKNIFSGAARHLIQISSLGKKETSDATFQPARPAKVNAPLEHRWPVSERRRRGGSAGDGSDQLRAMLVARMGDAA
jgi:hypothetical protein